MDRRRIELQIRTVVVTYRVEQRRRDARTMAGFRKRALSILDSLDEAAQPYPDLRTRINDARQELGRP